MAQMCDCHGKYHIFLILVPSVNHWAVGGDNRAQPFKTHLTEAGTETILLYNGAINFSSSLGSSPN